MRGATHLKTRKSVFAVVLLLLLVSTDIPYSAGSETLVSAARVGDIETSRQLLSTGADVNFPEPDGTTPLLWAVYNHSGELVDMLLEAGAEPNLANTLELTPLLQASRYGNAAMISALIDHGADISPAGTEPPLMAAARSGNPQAVQALLDAGADPDAVEPFDYQTAVMWAAAEGHHQVIEILLDAGANPNIKARESELTERKNADFPTGAFAALHWAARNGDEAMMKLLIDGGADINIRNGDGSTPMMLAIVNDRFDTAVDLLEMGADANDGSLYYATLMRDATTDWRAKDGTIFRADHDNEHTALALIKALLDAGADPNKPFDMQMHNASMCCDTRLRDTAFYRAAEAADVDTMKLMLGYGADPDWRPVRAPRNFGGDSEEEAEPKPGNSSLMVAINGGKGVGIAGGPNDLRYGPPDFREEGLRDPYLAVQLLLEAGANLSFEDTSGNTALHVAVRALHPDIVRALVVNGAALDAENAKEETALELAESIEAPKPVPGFYFKPPPAQPEEIAALLKELAADSEQQ